MNASAVMDAPARRNGAAFPITLPDVESLGEGLDLGGTSPQFGTDEAGAIYSLDERPPGEARVISLVNEILIRAVQDGASDVHLEPHRSGLIVRYRIDGMMFDRFAFRPELTTSILARVKIMAQMNVAERRLPLDGRFTARTRKGEYDVRVSTVPGALGEKAVLRLLPKGGRHLDLESLGLEGDNRDRLEALIQRPHGMVLVTGPTGSGKTTTLYAALRKINHVGRNTLTIEDPVEYEVPRVTQIQVHPKIGLTFAAGLKAVLRQDPDVVMVGEVRDAETLTIAIQAALTGHLVLSTLHCNDASGAAARCIDMGVEPFLFASAVSAIVAQRLVRIVCPDCREPKRLGPDSAALLGVADPNAEYFAGRGCEACRHTGYRGRTAVFEVLPMNEQVRTAVTRKEASDAIRRTAMQAGMTTMRSDAIRKMLAGITTPEEVLRAVYLEE